MHGHYYFTSPMKDEIGSWKEDLPFFVKYTPPSRNSDLIGLSWGLDTETTI